MCTPMNIIGGVLDVAKVAIDTSSRYSNLKSNNEYRTQIAINNAKAAQNEALRQKQLGIEKSRIEKINSMQEIAKIKSKNSASNLDISSNTNNYNYQDVLNSSKLQADIIKKEYDVKANEYFKKANSYLNQANDYNRQYNNSLLGLGMGVLEDSALVAKSWYDKFQVDANGGFDDYI